MFRSTLLAATALSVGIALGTFALRPHLVSADTKQSDTYEQLNLFGEVFEKVRTGYVEPVSDDKLIESAVNGMLSSLDPHSSYLNAKDFADMQVQTKGEFGGLGIEVTMQDGLVKVVSPMDGTPAAEAGIQAGDLISGIDGDPVMGMSLNDAVEKMRGEVGSSIKLMIVRGNKDPFEVTLKRAVITVKSVRWELEEGNIGYVRISSFSEKTDSGLRDAIAKLKDATKGKLAGLVLDLRNNPGGLLDQAIAVSDDFLEKGEIVSTRGRNPDEAQRWNAEAGDLTDGKPIVVLINGGSASASEIVSGALQDHHRAILLGTRSFGKGSVQSVIPIPNHGAIRLTTARYYTPSGRSIQAKGIDPDILVEQAKIEQISEDNSRHEADLKGALANKGGTAPDSDENAAPAKPENNAAQPETKTPGKTDSKTSDKDKSKEPPVIGSEKERITQPELDYQLGRALDLLRGLALVSNQKSSN